MLGIVEDDLAEQGSKNVLTIVVQRDHTDRIVMLVEIAHMICIVLNFFQWFPKALLQEINPEFILDFFAVINPAISELPVQFLLVIIQQIPAWHIGRIVADEIIVIALPLDICLETGQILVEDMLATEGKGGIALRRIGAKWQEWDLVIYDAVIAFDVISLRTCDVYLNSDYLFLRYGQIDVIAPYWRILAAGESDDRIYGRKMHLMDSFFIAYHTGACAVKRNLQLAISGFHANRCPTGGRCIFHIQMRDYLLQLTGIGKFEFNLDYSFSIGQME